MCLLILENKGSNAIVYLIPQNKTRVHPSSRCHGLSCVAMIPFPNTKTCNLVLTKWPKYGSFLSFLVVIWAYQPYTLVGPPNWRPVLAPLAVNSLTTIYKSFHFYCTNHFFTFVIFQFDFGIPACCNKLHFGIIWKETLNIQM